MNRVLGFPRAVDSEKMPILFTAGCEATALLSLRPLRIREIRQSQAHALWLLFAVPVWTGSKSGLTNLGASGWYPSISLSNSETWAVRDSPQFSATSSSSLH
jgi:hypothetical protein